MVEDNERLASNLREVLETAGYETVVARDGVEAFSILNGVGILPDLILSELTLDVMGGCRLLTLVRAQQRWSSVRFIFLTNTGSVPCRGTGLDDYIVKPFSVEELLSVIQRNLAGSLTY